MAEQYNIIAEQDESTVVARYDAPERDMSAYQSEAQLEKKLIKQLKEQGYGNPTIHNEAELLENMRVQLGELNNYAFSDSEWKRLLDSISNESLSMEDKAEMIQRDNTAILLALDSGENRNIHLLDKKNIHNNRLQVINQYVQEGGNRNTRYDVTILVNGLPLVHIELKKRGVSIREAFNQIDRYQRDTFWAGKGMFDFIQIFIISNGSETKYYSNSTRYAREKENTGRGHGKKVLSNSFEFTSYWSDRENKLILDIEDFAKTFLTKHTLLNMLTKFCVFTVDKTLMVMRPYQVAATEQILRRIQLAMNMKLQGSIKGGGYIWHTTGSGKTLTSFKTAQLATKIEGVEKVLFIVDRQDLDYQTMKEYDNFKPGCANGNANSSILLGQLNDANAKIIITTIQKLSTLLRKEKIAKEILVKNIVFIFDECHRSQFGEMHSMIKKKFKNYMMFGFTGTPIFAVNANKYGKNVSTTAQVFGGELDNKGNHTKALHTYTIINAINDRNVLKFNVEYHLYKAEKAGTVLDSAYYMNPERISKNVAYLLKNFDIKTKAADSYSMSKLMNVDDVVRNFRLAKENQKEEKKGKMSVRGFNSILACDSVDMAIAYYKELKRQMQEPGKRKLTLAIIYTSQANEEENEATGNIEENPESVENMDATSRDFLDRCIKEDYNPRFGTSYDTSSEKFQSYYKDVSLRMKNRDIDLLIVVGMFLTGFDAQCLNTLWVDKNLKMHGLLQAYSRTNRILNAVKNCGNVVCFRNLEEQTNASFALFGDEDANGIILMRPFNDYYYGYDDEKEGKHYIGYKEIAETLLERYPLRNLNPHTPEADRKAFIKLFSQFVKMFNLLMSFDKFNSDDPDEQDKVRIIKAGELQEYRSWYLNFYEDYKQGKKGDSGMTGETDHSGDDEEDSIEFELDLIKQVQIDIPFILALVKQYHDTNCEDHELLQKITRSITSSPSLRDKKELITGYIDSIKPGKDIDVYDEWQKFIDREKKEELDTIIKEENLKSDEAKKFIEKALNDGFVEENGTGIVKLLPPMPIFGAGAGKREEKKKTVIEKINSYVSKFFNL